MTALATRRAHLAWTLVAAIALLALVQFVSLPTRPKILSVINNFAHGPVFGALALLLLGWLRPLARGRAWIAYAGAFFSATAAGSALEFMQIFTHRDASVADAVTNALGAAAALCLVASREQALRPTRRPSWSRHLGLAGAVLLVVLLMPVTRALDAYATRARRFPTIMQFASRSDMYFVELRDSEATLVSPPSMAAGARSQRGLKIRFRGDDWPGIEDVEPVPDWTRFRRLRIDLSNPGVRPLLLGLRLHDIGHGQDYTDRFNASFTIDAKAHRVLDVALEDVARGPAHRELDLSRIGGLVLFRLSPADNQAPELVLTRVWLE